MRLRWTMEAADDLEEIADWFRANAPHAEKRIVSEIYASSKALKSMPYVGRRAGEAGTYELVLPDLKYVNTYRIRGDVIDIAKIRHGARKPLN